MDIPYTKLKTQLLPDKREIILSVPQKCPICHCKIFPKILSANKRYSDSENCNYCVAFFQCPSCNKVYSASAKIEFEASSLFTSTCYFFPSSDASFTPFAPEIPELPQALKQDAFKKFQSVYNDACAADSYGLHEVAGIGYRKCIEFLIKDFLLLTSPENEKEICDPKKTLMSLINKLITDPGLQEIAAKTTWLANDETHYTRLHTDKDLNDVRDFFFIVLEEVSRNMKILELKKINKG